MLANLIKRAAVVNRYAVIAKDVEPGSLEDMRQWQHRQGDVMRIDRQPACDAQHVRDKAVMGQHYSFRLAGCARGVNDRREITRTNVLQKLFKRCGILSVLF